MEEEWDDKVVAEKFTLFTEKELKKGWKVHAVKFCMLAAGVHGINTCAPLLYLLRDQLIPTKDADDDNGEYPALDH